MAAKATRPIGWQMTAVAHGFAPTKANVKEQIVDVLHGDKCGFESKKDEVKGKIALCDEGVTEGQRALHRTEKLALAVEYGAAGLAILSSAAGCLPRTGVCWRGEAPIPSFGIGLEDGTRIRRLLAAGKAVTMAVNMTNSLSKGEARNVLADLKGCEKPDEIVIAGGHLDSWDISQGAVDNGLGCAIVLEMARVLASLGRRPRRTLRFAMWAAEEIGLLGSRHYVNSHKSELPDHVGVLNFDMTGDPFGYWTPGHKEPAPLLKGLVDQLAPIGMRHEYANKAGLHSDHQWFMLEGVPIISPMAQLAGEGGRYYHSVGDTYEKVDLPGLCRAAAVGAMTMWAIADAPDRVFNHLNAMEVKKMVEESDLLEALAVDGWSPSV
jgi:Zn-dependent M28 family amino/carboxypeptidase